MTQLNALHDREESETATNYSDEHIYKDIGPPASIVKKTMIH